MACGTKARRSCLSQLVEEGFLSIGENGIVTIHDPYSVYQEQPEDSIPSVKFEFDYIGEDFPRTECGESKKIKASSDQIIKEKSDLPELHKLQMKQEIITTWNEYKPASYSKIRTISDKQLQAVLKHLKNLGLKTSSIPEFIQAISKGIVNSDFWLNKVDQSGRNFSAIFGYGNAQDTKMRNVESLYALAEEATQTKEPVGLYDASQNELIRTFKYVSFEYEKACNRSNQADIAKWQNHLGSLKLQLAEAGINLEEI